MLRFVALGALVAALLGLAPLAQARPAASLTLSVAFFADGTINVTLPDGTPVGTTSGAPTVIPAGAYTVVFSGPGGCITLPLFTLKGPNMNIQSDMNGGEVDAATSNAFLAPNSTFTWRADRGVAAVTHTFVTSGTVAAAAASASASPSATPAQTPTSQDIVGSGVVPARGALLAGVGANGALTLRFKGKTPARLPAGRYTLTVSDTSKKSGVVLTDGSGKPRTLTGGPFVGRHTVSLQLTAGRWLFAATAGHAARAVVVS